MDGHFTPHPADLSKRRGRRAKQRVIEEEVIGLDEPMSDGVTVGDSMLITPTRIVRIPLWEARWPRERLLEYWETLGSSAVAHGYTQLPVDESTLIFKAKWIDDALDTSYVIPDEITTTSPFSRMRRFGGLDIAVGDKEGSSAFWVMAVIAVDPRTNHRYLISLERHRGLSLLQQFDIVGQVYRTHKFEVCGVESNNIQGAIESHLRVQGIAPTRAIHTGALQKSDEQVGIPSMAVEWEQGKWHIPWGDARSRRIMEPLVAEFKTYPTAKFFDTVMACYFAREMYRQGPQARPQFIKINF
jgi:hypothetical protein